MAKRPKSGVRFRDSRTGRFVSKSTYNRSRAQGGTRYKKTRITKRPKPKAPQGEYQINVKYKGAQKSKVEVQISARGPKGASRADVEAAVQYRIENGEDKPGWKTHVTEWLKGTRTYKGDDKEGTWQSIGFLFPESEKRLV